MSERKTWLSRCNRATTDVAIEDMVASLEIFPFCCSILGARSVSLRIQGRFVVVALPIPAVVPSEGVKQTSFDDKTSRPGTQWGRGFVLSRARYVDLFSFLLRCCGGKIRRWGERMLQSDWFYRFVILYPGRKSLSSPSLQDATTSRARFWMVVVVGVRRESEQAWPKGELIYTLGLDISWRKPKFEVCWCRS